MSDDDQKPVYFHPAWVRAIHRFCREYETHKGIERGTTPLKAIQDFHSQWYQNKNYRLRANEVVECPVCKNDFEEAAANGEPFPQPCPEDVRRRAQNFGIRFSRGAIASLTPSRV